MDLEKELPLFLMKIAIFKEEITLLEQKITKLKKEMK